VITAEQFRARVGRDPEQDDLQRCNCNKAGDICHYFCGWCRRCDCPRFVCGHYYINPPSEGC
jgi:hypothetical protein